MSVAVETTRLEDVVGSAGYRGPAHSTADIQRTVSMKAGDRMTFTLMPDATVIMRVKTKSVTELAGVLHKKGRKPVPVEQLSR